MHKKPIYIIENNMLYSGAIRTLKKGVRKADYEARRVMRVAFVAPIYMNPKQKKDEDARRRKRRTKTFEETLKKLQEQELPEDSTVSFYA